MSKMDLSAWLALDHPTVLLFLAKGVLLPIHGFLSGCCIYDKKARCFCNMTIYLSDGAIFGSFWKDPWAASRWVECIMASFFH